jgi:hypothetical protein
MIVRPIVLETEYPAFAEWWSARGFPAPPKPLLEDAHGFAVTAGIDILAGWLFVCGKTAFLEWIVGNPAVASSTTTRESVLTLLDFLNGYAKGIGVCALLCSTRDDGSLGRLMQRVGWAKCEGPPHQLYAKGVI